MALGVPPPDSVIKEGIFIQPLTPIGDSLIGSFFVGIIPLIVVLALLGIFRVPAYAAAASGLFTCIFIAIFGWHMPAQQAFEAIGNGVVYALWPIMWVVVNAMYLYNITIRSGAFHLFRKWMMTNTPPDKRIILLIISFCFGSLLEGVAGFGVPGAICSSMLVSLGFDPLDAIVYTLLFNTTPVAFGSLGIPVTTLASLTGLPVMSLSAMMGRQLPFISVILPGYVLSIFAGFKAGLVECWPVALVSGFVFAIVQAVFANWVGPELPDVIAGLASLISVMGFVQHWKPPYRSEYEANMDFLLSNDTSKTAALADSGREQFDDPASPKKGKMMVEHQEFTTSSADFSSSSVDVTAKKNNDNSHQIGTQSHVVDTTGTRQERDRMEKLTWRETCLAWMPWITVVITVMIWSFAKVSHVGQINVQWPHLHEKVWLTLYGKKYDAIWGFQPLATGTAILVSTIPFSALLLFHGVHPRIFPEALKDTAVQLYRPVVTVSFIMAFAYLLNYSGIVYTIGYQLSSVGRAFPFLSAWLGWVACFLSGSDTSANSLFGNLQVVAAREIGLSTVLMAATNSAGAITSKMVSPQNLTTGVSTIGLQGKEGQILRRTLLHSIGMCCIMGAMACIQQYLIPGMIPSAE
ncbi:lactate permease [Mucor ambiguus]|uniref:Lactate permease n=1 Tax=Mucor ambiguus TaxID=91626 RepID=A0A0C9M4E1_9FUNG|nr:lactate permease [Mucor ambiguus]